MKSKLLTPMVAVALFAGSAAGVAALASAQTPTNSTTTTSSAGTANTVDTTSNTSATSAQRPMGHAPLGGDGIVSAINGTTLTMQEESDEGGATYTVDASSATITKGGATATLADFKVGDKIFVKGTVSGTQVAATSVSLGHMGGHGPDAPGQQ